MGGQDNVVGTATNYGLDGLGFESRHGQQISILKNCPEHGSSAWVKWLGCKMDSSFSSTAEVKYEWNYASTLPVCLNGMARLKGLGPTI
jgi:hypothetical protein